MCNVIKIGLIILFNSQTLLFAQGISGRVVYASSKYPLQWAAIQVFQDGILKGGHLSDTNGFYFIKPLAPGNYDLLVPYTGYDSIRVKSVLVKPDKLTTRNIRMKKVNRKYYSEKVKY